MARQSQVPDPALVSEFIDGLYHPEFIPEELDLTNFLVEVEREDLVRESLEKKKTSAATLAPSPQTPGGAPLLLTEAEAREADRQIEATLQRIKDTRGQINLVRSKIDQAIESSGGGGSEFSFKMDISKKPRIRRAIKKLFGVKTDTITYSMYKDMLAAKKSLETEQAEAYTEGFPKKKDKKGKRKKKDKGDNQGFLERSSNQDEFDGSSQSEEQYERMFPKIGRDFVYKDDFYNAMDNIVSRLSLTGFGSGIRSDSEARKRALEYKKLLDQGKDGSSIYKDLIKLDDEEEEL